MVIRLGEKGPVIEAHSMSRMPPTLEEGLQCAGLILAVGVRTVIQSHDTLPFASSRVSPQQWILGNGTGLSRKRLEPGAGIEPATP